VPEWGWVAVAYVLAYGSFAVFAFALATRIRSARRELEGVAEEAR
jgi:hypothetical protein